MNKMMIAGIALAALGTLAWPANSHEKHAHESYSAGEPGNPRKSSRTIEVEMSEMAYTPSRIEVKHGDPRSSRVRHGRPGHREV